MEEQVRTLAALPPSFASLAIQDALQAFPSAPKRDISLLERLSNLSLLLRVDDDKTTSTVTNNSNDSNNNTVTLLDRLTTLTVTGSGAHIQVLLDLVARCPALQELNVGG